MSESMQMSAGHTQKPFLQPQKGIEAASLYKHLLVISPSNPKRQL